MFIARRMQHPVLLLVLMVGIVSGVELGVMYLFPLFEVRLDIHDRAWVDAALLGILTSPVLYVLIVKPLKRITNEALQNNSSLVMSRHMFEFGSEAVVTFKPNLKVVDANEAFFRLTGYAQTEIGQLHISDIMGNEEHKLFVERRFESFLFDQSSWTREIVIRTRHRQLIFVRMKLTRVEGFTDDVPLYVASFEDLSDLQKAQLDLDLVSNYDISTQLPNKKYMMDALPNLMRTEGKLALFVLHLNQYRNINDTYGYALGHKYVQCVADTLLDFCNKDDIQARIRQDKLALVVTHYFDEDHVVMLANKMLEKIAGVQQVEDALISGTGKIGICLYPAHASSPDELLRGAELALNTFEHDPLRKICMFDNSMVDSLKVQTELEVDLSQAITDGQFELHYQPQIAVEGKRLIGMEALLRWKRADGRYISPAVFVPVLEKMGKIPEVGNWVLRTACMQGARWFGEGLGPFTIGVNVSAHQLMVDSFAGDVMKILMETHFPPQWLQLEITESAVVQNVEASSRMLRDLGSLGIQIAIDDFGTGYSSLSYLKRFPVIDKLKIDKSFVDSIAPDAEAVITNAIIGLAKSLGMKAIAEGVENEMQLEYLHRHGCEEVQGYYFSKPLAAFQVESYLKVDNVLPVSSQALSCEPAEI